MKKVFCTLLILFTTILTAQNNLIQIDTVIKLEGLNKDVLYNRVRNFLTSNIKSQKQTEYLFKEEDKEKGVIKIEGSFNHKTKFSGKAFTDKVVTYDYEVYFKDNKIRVIIENFKHPYFGAAIDELPYPKGNKTGINGKKWYGKVYTEFHNNSKNVMNNLIQNTSMSVLVKDKIEEDW